MTRILKYHLTADFGKHSIDIPGLIDALSVKTQNDSIVLYALVDESNSEVGTIKYINFATGSEYSASNKEEGYAYCKTSMLCGGRLVVHTFVQIGE